MLQTRTYQVPGICRTGKESTFLQNIGLFYVIIHFIRSRINWLDLIIGNMASNDEGQGSVDCDDVYLAADEFLREADDQRMLLLGPPIASETETDIQTDAETETGAETSADTSRADVEPKAKRQRRPNQLMTTRLVVTEMDDDIFEPIAPVEARSCYGNQIGWIVRTTATINDEKL